MKICVYFNPGESKDVFEGKRLRKNIKGALELEDIDYAKDIIDQYDILHLISVQDGIKINYAREEGIPVVFSTMMCESDKSANVLTYNRETKNYVLTARALKILNQVDAVLVNDKASKSFLINNGVTSPIKIAFAGVNVSRFVIKDELETELFRNYFQLLPNSKFIATIGDHKNKANMSKLIQLARLCPQYQFFFFSPNARFKGMSKLKRILKRMPKNIRVAPLLSDEVYCSMMRDASGYLIFPDALPSPITLFDAMAAKTLILALSPQPFNEEMISDGRSLIANSVIELADQIREYAGSSDAKVIQKAYDYAKSHSLHHLGDELIEIYKDVMKGEKK